MLAASGENSERPVALDLTVLRLHHPSGLAAYVLSHAIGSRAADGCMIWDSLSYAPHRNCELPEALRELVDVVGLDPREEGDPDGAPPAGETGPAYHWSAVERDGRALAAVPEEHRTLELCCAAVKRHMSALQHVPPKLAGSMAKTLVEVAINRGALLIWPVHRHKCDVVPLVVTLRRGVQARPCEDLFTNFLSYDKQQTLFYYNISNSHQDHIGKCYQRVVCQMGEGVAIGVVKSNKRGGTKRAVATVVDDNLTRARRGLHIAKQLVEWFRGLRRDVTLMKAFMAPRESTRISAAQDYLKDVGGELDVSMVDMLDRFILTRCQGPEVARGPFEVPLRQSVRRVLVALKHERLQSNKEQPQMHWDVFNNSEKNRKNFQHLLKSISSHRNTIPWGNAAPTADVNWGDLAIAYGSYGSEGPIELDESSAVTCMSMLGSFIHQGRWERAFRCDESDLVYIPPGDATRYNIVVLNRNKDIHSMQLRIMDLDEVGRTRGKHLTEASAKDLVGHHFRVEGRRGTPGLPYHIPYTEDDGRYKQTLCRMWQHLDGISDTCAQHIAAWSPLQARREGILKKPGKQHTTQDPVTRKQRRVGIGQPTESQSLRLLDAALVQLVWAQEGHDDGDEEGEDDDDDGGQQNGEDDEEEDDNDEEEDEEEGEEEEEDDEEEGEEDDEETEEKKALMSDRAEVVDVSKLVLCIGALCGLIPNRCAAYAKRKLKVSKTEEDFVSSTQDGHGSLVSRVREAKRQRRDAVL